MYSKGKGSVVPSDAQSREKLALYVYEYLIHSGAQKAAQLFLQEIRWEKAITLAEPPGFLHSWWSVFWDLYSAAPERRDTFEHSNEAKAFHDYGFVNSGYPNGMGHNMAAPSPLGIPPQEGGPIPPGGMPPGFFPPGQGGPPGINLPTSMEGRGPVRMAGPPRGMPSYRPPMPGPQPARPGSGPVWIGGPGGSYPSGSPVAFPGASPQHQIDSGPDIPPYGRPFELMNGAESLPHLHPHSASPATVGSGHATPRTEEMTHPEFGAGYMEVSHHLPPQHLMNGPPQQLQPGYPPGFGELLYTYEGGGGPMEESELKFFPVYKDFPYSHLTKP